MDGDRPEPEFNGYQILIPRRLVEAILLRDDERREIPANVSEAREQRILNKRWLGF